MFSFPGKWHASLQELIIHFQPGETDVIPRAQAEKAALKGVLTVRRGWATNFSVISHQCPALAFKNNYFRLVPLFVLE